MAGPMTKLMQRGAIPVDRLMECRLRWDLHKVMARTVEGFAPADLEPCATRRDQPVGLGDGEHRVGAEPGHNINIGQSLAMKIGRAACRVRGCQYVAI